ncbi:MAG TPA: hypothetical protein VF681_11710 [Abditibacteriaceae bacterium]|jgi:hypothetical protein
MSQRDVAFLACRILALSAAVSGVKVLSTTLYSGLALLFPNSSISSTFGNIFDWKTVALLQLPPALMLGVAFLLWNQAAWLSHRMAPADTSVPASSLEFAQWRRLSFGLLGAWILADAAANVVNSGLAWRQLAAGGANSMGMPNPHLGPFVGTVVQMAIGFWLFSGAPGVRDMAHRIRNAGRDVEAKDA